MHNLTRVGIAFLFTLFIQPAIGQSNNVWTFGYKAALDFNEGSPKSIASEILSSEGCASICDDDGRLLFYTNGDWVWNAQHTVMPNGRNLGDGGVAMAGSSSQGALIIPKPGNPQQYYVFTLGNFENPYYYGRLYYSIVDMSRNNGLGDVTTKGVFIDANLTEQMTAVAGVKCNIWLLAADRNNGSVKAWNIDDDGIDSIPVISPGLPTYGVMGCMAASPDGTKLVVGLSNFALFDFDIVTGIASNPFSLIESRGFAGVCFSPNSSKLYVGGLQFDLSAGNPNQIRNSQTLVGNIQNSKIGPDGKIYCNTGSNTMMGVIEYPDLPGMACQFVKDRIVLNSGYIRLGLPNIVVKRPAGDTLRSVQEIEAGCFTKQLTLLPEGSGKSYVWDNGSTDPQRTVDKAGTYWRQYKIACDVFIDTFEVSFPNGVLPDINILNSCKGQSNGKVWASTYAGDDVQYHYLWQNSSRDTLSLTDTLYNIPSGYYTLHVATEQCDTTLTFFVPEETYDVSFHADTLTCQGTELNFRNTSDPHFTQFQWDFGDGNHSLITEPRHIYTDAGKYQVVVTGIGNVCSDTALLVIVVDSIHSTEFSIRQRYICIGERIFINPEKDNSAIQLCWQFGDGEKWCSEWEQDVQHAYAAAGMMKVTLRTEFRACPDSYFEDSIYVVDLPDVALGSDQGLCPNSSAIVLENLMSETDSNCRYIWSTGDTTAYLRVTQAGTYSLTVSRMPLGCSNTAFVTITKDCYMDIPNAFSPDHDGVNDYFFPRQLLSKNIIQFKMQIWNRWGQEMFSTTNLHGRGWDGKWKGVMQPQGVYMYSVEWRGQGGNAIQQHGNITLIR